MTSLLVIFIPGELQAITQQRRVLWIKRLAFAHGRRHFPQVLDGLGRRRPLPMGRKLPPKSHIVMGLQHGPVRCARWAVLVPCWAWIFRKELQAPKSLFGMPTDGQPGFHPLPSGLDSLCQPCCKSPITRQTKGKATQHEARTPTGSDLFYASPWPDKAAQEGLPSMKTLELACFAPGACPPRQQELLHSCQGRLRPG